MIMKTLINRYLFLINLFVSISLFSGCDFLDIVPDERANEEDVYKDVNAARGFLYSCYSYMPVTNSMENSMDFLTGDEVVTCFDTNPFSDIPRGNYSAANLKISYWSDLYNGIRQSYILMKNIDRVPNIEPYKDEMVAELNFLIGYYHMLLFRCYGPVIIVDHEVDINISPEKYASRSTLAQTVQFICDRFDDAIQSQGLPETREGVDMGRATKVIARALKAYTLMYYASPLFNGNTELANKLKNIDGSDLLDANYDPERWNRARDAYEQAVSAAEAAGHVLFDEINPMLMTNPFPENSTLRHLRANLCTKIKYNKEELWARFGDEGIYGMQKNSMPFILKQNYNNISPTMNMIRRFYTKNGLPYKVDPETKNSDEFGIVTLDNENSKVVFADGTEAVIALEGRQTSLLNLNREPRYYAWISFQNGFYEVKNASYNGGYDNNSGNINGPMKDKVIVTDFLKNGNCGRDTRNRNYSPSGFLNKKGVHPDNECSKNNIAYKPYPWPLLRLADLYLGYAECCAESGDDVTAKIYLNKVRKRAGIPDVDTSWKLVGKIPKGKDLVDIIRQERQIEFYLENQNFWDMRRWKLADKYFNHKHTGMNIDAQSMEEFSKETEIPFLRSFEDANWLYPIPQKDINCNHNLAQNPGY